VSPVLFSLALVIAAATFAAIMLPRARLLLAADAAPRFDHLGERLRRTAVYAFGQKKFLKGEQPAGIMHAAGGPTTSTSTCRCSARGSCSAVPTR
jgi:hypothetical protein